MSLSKTCAVLACACLGIAIRRATAGDWCMAFAAALTGYCGLLVAWVLSLPPEN